MDNVSFIKVTGIDGVEREHAIIDKGNVSYTSMLKSTFDEMIASREASTL
jgi:hypothetical protein